MQTDTRYIEAAALDRAERENSFTHAFGFSNRKSKAKQRRERKGFKS